MIHLITNRAFALWVACFKDMLKEVVLKTVIQIHIKVSIHQIPILRFWSACNEIRLICWYICNFFILFYVPSNEQILPTFHVFKTYDNDFIFNRTENVLNIESGILKDKVKILQFSNPQWIYSFMIKLQTVHLFFCISNNVSVLLVKCHIS